MKHGKLLGFLLVIIVISGLVVYFNPSILDNIAPNTTLSISSINVDPQGTVVGDEYRGSFWNILVYVNANDQLAGVVLPEGQTGSVNYQGAMKALETGAKVEVKIDPGTPYMIRSVVQNSKLVAPAATGAGSTVDARYLTYYSWGESTWRIYTPFTVSIYKDGSLVGQKTLNMEGENAVQTVSTSEGNVRIENLGILGGSYQSYSTPSQIAILGGSHVYDWTQIQSVVSGSTSQFANYWYGNSRNSNGQAYNPTVVFGVSTTTAYQPSKYGGWSGSDSGTNVKPIRPVIFSSEKSNLPSEERSFYCVTEYIEQNKGISNLASSLFSTRSTGNTGSLFQKAEFVTDTNGQTALKLEIPWGAFGTPLVSIRVPTELADTWVEQPIVTGNIDLSAAWVSTGSTIADLYGSSRVAVTVTNTGTVTGSARLTIASGNSKLSITPLEMTVNNLEPNVPQIVYFDGTNLGVENEISSIPITVKAYDTYTGTERASVTIYGTLKPTLATGESKLVMHVVEKGTVTPIVGLQFTMQYGDKAPTAFSGANGLVEMTLENPQGGAYTGQVYVSSADTTIYKTASATYNFDQAKVLEVTFEVERKDTAYKDDKDWMTYLIIILVIIIFAIIISVGVYAVRKNKRGGRRRYRGR